MSEEQPPDTDHPAPNGSISEEQPPDTDHSSTMSEEQPPHTDHPAPNGSISEEQPPDTDHSSTMSEEQPPNTDHPAPDMFPVVWVKMEVDDDGVVEGVDYEEPETQGLLEERQKVEPVKRHRRKLTTPKKAMKLSRVKNLQCEICDYRTSYKTSLKYHYMDHNDAKPLSCELCSYTTKYAVSMRRHIMGQHEAKNPNCQEVPKYHCQECPYTTLFKGNLVAHQRKHSADKKYKCNQCDFSTAYRHSYLKHSNTHKPKEPVTFECDKCPFITKYEGHISRHLAQIHKEISEKASKCDYCDFTTNVKWRLNVHKNRMRREQPIKCVFCEFTSDYNCAFKKHKLEHLHVQSKTIHETDIYTVNKDYQAPVRVKKATPTDVAPPPSTENGKQFILDKESEEIDWRSIEVTERPGETKPFKCIQCQYQARFKASVQRHFQRHHTSKNMRPYKCVNCDFSTKTKDQILLHNKRSISTTPLQCRTCDFTTYFKCQNVMHQKVHYPFKCSVCDYMCRQSFDMHRHHSTVHLGEGLQCRYCDFKATRRESLVNHEFKHTGVKPFRCGHCDYSAVRRSLLDNHIRKNHCGINTEPLIIDHNKIQSLKKVDSGFCSVLRTESIPESVFQNESRNFEEQIQNESNFEDEIQNESNYENENVCKFESDNRMFEVGFE